MIHLYAVIIIVGFFTVIGVTLGTAWCLKAEIAEVGAAIRALAARVRVVGQDAAFI